MAQPGASNGGGIDEGTSDCLTSLLLLDLGDLLLSFSTSLFSSIMKINNKDNGIIEKVLALNILRV